MGLNAPDVAVEIGSMKLQNPIMTASGTFGYGVEFKDYVDLNSLGAIIVKGISLQPRPGNPPPRVVETSCGMLNAIGLENVGVDRFLQEKLPPLRKYSTGVVVNILGDSVEEYQQLAEKLNDQDGVDALEVNISCPNVKKGGVSFGTDPKVVYEITQKVRLAFRGAVMMKLSPNVTDITTIARAAEDGGADGVSLINTLIGMAIDIKTRKPRLANKIGGLSGPAIKPVALRMVWQVAQAVSVPVIGIGGISSVDDVVEFLIAGATAVQLGTANLVSPSVSGAIVTGLEKYLKENKINGVHELIGSVNV